MSLVTGLVLGYGIALLGASALTGFATYLLYRDAREQERTERSSQS